MEVLSVLLTFISSLEKSLSAVSSRNPIQILVKVWHLCNSTYDLKPRKVVRLLLVARFIILDSTCFT